MIIEEISDIQFQTDGRTVWVNGPEGLIGRWSEFRGDVHSADTSACVACGKTSWNEWVDEMFEAHGVIVPARYQPPASRSSECEAQRDLFDPEGV